MQLRRIGLFRAYPFDYGKNNFFKAAEKEKVIVLQDLSMAASVAGTGDGYRSDNCQHHRCYPDF